MSAPAAISASLVDVRNVAQHKCVRLEIHVPAEQAGLVLAAFGWPTSVDPVPVAIARLDLSKAVSDAPEKPNSPPRNFADLPAPQQAALRCNDPNFQKFLVSDGDAEKAANRVRLICHVKSRSELATNADARAKWIELDDAFYRWQRGFR